MSDYLNHTPVDVTIKALETQVEQLKRLVGGNTLDNSQDLQQEINSLKIANEKAEFRIRILLRALEERDAKK